MAYRVRRLLPLGYCRRVRRLHNRATQTLTIEDPQLKYYLRELSW